MTPTDRLSTVSSNAHLADYPVRLGPPRAAWTPPSRPHPDADWTLAETLDEIAYRDVSLTLASSGVKVTHGHRLPAVARNVARHETALRVWLRLGAAAGTVAPGWGADVRLHAAWFLRLFEPPAGPLALAPGVTVRDVPRYREAIAARLALGPDAPGADALRATLAALFDRFGADAARLVHPEPAYAVAA